MIWLVHLKWRTLVQVQVLPLPVYEGDKRVEFSGVSIAIADDCKGDVLIRVSVPQGLISEASWVHLSFMSDMVLMCVCSNSLTLELSAAVFSSCLAAFLEVERRCGSDTTQLHYKQAYILLVARLISPLFHPQRIRTKLILRLFVLNY